MFVARKSHFVILLVITIMAHFLEGAVPTLENDKKKINTRLAAYANTLKMKINAYIPITQSYACQLPPDDKKDLCISITRLMKNIADLVFRKDTNDSRNWNYKCKFEKVRFIEGSKTGSSIWMKIFRCPVYLLKRPGVVSQQYVASDEFYVSTGDDLNTVFLYKKSPYNLKEFLVEGHVFGLDYARKVPTSKILKKFRRLGRTKVANDEAKNAEILSS